MTTGTGSLSTSSLKWGVATLCAVICAMPLAGVAAASQEPPIVLVQAGAPAFERNWDRATRVAVQEALVWTGDYDAKLDGAIGPRTRTAIKDFQRRRGYPATGQLTARQYEALRADARAAVEAVGFRIVDDAETGIRIGIPQALVQRSHRDGPTIVYRPASGEGITSLALISMPGGRGELDDLFDVLTAPDVVEPDAYKVLNQNFIVVSDEKDGTSTYTYVRAADGALKGFTLGWPEAETDTFGPIATAMFNSFQPIRGVLEP